MDLSERLNADDRFVNASKNLEALVSGIKNRATDSCGFFRVNGNPEEDPTAAPAVEVKKPQKFRLIVPSKKISSTTTVLPDSESSQRVLPGKKLPSEPERPKIKDFSLFDEFVFNKTTNSSPPTVKPIKDFNPTRGKSDTLPQSKTSDNPIPSVPNTSCQPTKTPGSSSDSLRHINRENTNPATETPPPIRKKFVFQSTSRSKTGDAQSNFSFEDKPIDNHVPESKKPEKPSSSRSSSSIRKSTDDDDDDFNVRKAKPSLSQSSDDRNRSPQKPKSPRKTSQSNASSYREVSNIETVVENVPKKRSKFVPQVPRRSLSSSKYPNESANSSPPIAQVSKITGQKNNSAEMILRDLGEDCVSASSSQEPSVSTVVKSRSEVATNSAVDPSDEFDDLINGTYRSSEAEPIAAVKGLTGFEGLAEFTENISNANELRAPTTVSSLNPK